MGKLRIQKCGGCGAWQWGPEWICHRCHSFDLRWHEIVGRGRIYSYQRPHHPVHTALNGHGPYIAVLVELPDYGNIRMVGNLLGDPRQAVTSARRWRRCSNRTTRRTRLTRWFSGRRSDAAPDGGKPSGALRHEHIADPAHVRIASGCAKSARSCAAAGRCADRSRGRTPRPRDGW